MCGITGIYNFYKRPVDRVEIISMTDTLAHRGPDDSGYWIQDDIGFGHRRLSILDLSPLGHQPMKHLQLPIVVTFNGEIYNYIELRQELEKLGHKFITDCDTEVLLASYVEWGVYSIDRFNGMFAFGLWDGRDHSLLLARDRYGKKPLYYSINQSKIVFASELKALHQVRDLSLSINLQAVQSFMEWRYIPGAISIYNEVQKLLPGNCLKIKNDGTTEQRCYFNAITAYSDGLKNQEPKNTIEELEKLEQLITNAVRIRMRSDVPYGALLSGGTDSSLVVALMSSISAAPVKTFSIGYRNSRVSEALFAKQTADFLKTDHTELYVEPADVMSLIQELAKWYDEPFADESAMPTMLISRLARKNVTVALSGDGGDEFFAGYNYYRWAMQAARFNRCFPEGVRKGIAWMLLANKNDMVKKKAKLLQQNSPSDIFAYLSNPFKDAQVAKLLRVVGQTKQMQYSEWMDTYAEISFPDRFMLHDIENYLSGDILTKVDRASMSCSLEVRCPLLDKEVTAFALRSPLSLKWNGNVQKYALKKILYKYIPKKMMVRPKTGFAIPVGEWFRKELKSWTEDLLFGTNQINDFIDMKYLKVLWREHVYSGRNHVGPLWGVLMLQLWFSTFHTHRNGG